MGLGVTLLCAMGAVLAWWAWKRGAFFGVDFYPGAVVFYGLLITLLLAAPLSARLRGWPALALAALLGLAAWMLLSILWTPTRSSSVAYAEHVFLYAAAFALSMWLCNLLGRRMILALFSVAVAVAVAGGATVIALGTGHDVSSYLHADASLRFPLGYRNANAAFFLIGIWPAVTLASDRDIDARLRALMLATATLCLEVAVLCQSRGSMYASAASLLVFLAVSPSRLRIAAFLVLATLPAIPAIPALLDVYRHGVPISDAVPLLRSAARAITISCLAGLAVAVIAMRIDARVRPSEKVTRAIGKALAVSGVLLALGGGIAFVHRYGDPIEFLNQRVHEFNAGSTPNLHSQGARFGANVGTNRKDFWRVALTNARHHPLLGEGAGSFRSSYLPVRRSDEMPQDPHSVEALMLSELGVPGLVLLTLFVVAATAGAWRSRALGPGAKALSAAALGAGAYWLVQASYDWFWNYPAVTAPVIGLAAAACAPALLHPDTRRSLNRCRLVTVALVAALAATAFPLWISQRYVRDAYKERPHDLAAAYADLEHAHALNPLDTQPLLSKADIANIAGDRATAVIALRKAIEIEPDDWLSHYFLGVLLSGRDPATSRGELVEAHRLNPLDPQVRRAAARSRRAAARPSS